MLEVGFGKATITPPLGTPLGGYEKRQYHAIGVHDDLYARCMLFHESTTDQYLALIVCDLLWVNYQFSDQIKEIVQEITFGKVKKEHVIVHAIHTHSSQRFDQGLDFFYQKVKKPHEFDRGWYVEHGIPYLQRAIASSVYGSLQDLHPALLKYNRGSTDVGHNRRIGDPDAQLVDTELFAMVILHAEGKVLGETVRGIFYNLATHCVALGEQNYYLSQDWPYWTSQLLQHTYQLPWTSQIIFTQGTAGNINPWNCKFDDEVREMGEAERVGVHAAADIIRTMRLEDLHDLNSLNQPVDLKHLTHTIQIEVTDPEKITLFKSFGLYWLGIEEIDGKVILNVRIHLVKLNSVVLVCVPGELFGEFGIEIKKKIQSIDPSLVPVVLELSDGAVGYITTRGTYYKKKYEASLCASPETGYRIVAEVGEMLHEVLAPR